MSADEGGAPGGLSESKRLEECSPASRFVICRGTCVPVPTDWLPHSGPRNPRGQNTPDSGAPIAVSSTRTASLMNQTDRLGSPAARSQRAGCWLLAALLLCTLLPERGSAAILGELQPQPNRRSQAKWPIILLLFQPACYSTPRQHRNAVCRACEWLGGDLVHSMQK